MSSDSLPPLPDNRTVVRFYLSVFLFIFFKFMFDLFISSYILLAVLVMMLSQLGCGGVGLDFLAAVASFPKPDDKIRSTSLKVFSFLLIC